MSAAQSGKQCLARMSRILGLYPRAVGILCGYTLALVFAMATAWTALQLHLQDIDKSHAQLLHEMQAVQTDVGRLLDTLNAGHAPLCTHANLNQLRSLLFQHRYARDIGLLDAQKRLFCTTDIGPLATPVAPSGTGIDGSIGRYYRHFSLPLAQTTVQVTLVQRGPFVVAMEPNAAGTAFYQRADAVWAGRNSQRTLIYRGKRVALTDAPLPPDTPHLRLDAAHRAVRVTNTAMGISPVSVQSVLLPHDLYQDHLGLLASVVALCVLLGYLASDVVTRRCRHFQSMDYRIRHLCDPAYVVCHYQPILDLATGRVTGCEVLARLRDGNTLVYPDQFIPALVRQNLAWTFDAAVSAHALQALGTALTRLPARPAASQFKVALNFFPQNLRRDAIHTHLQAQLQTCGYRDLQIELEVTEYNFSPEIVPELRRLKADGYGISIDDFGTGYSNLGMVKRVAPDFLKIDKSFVFEMEDATLRASLIPEIIAIAKAVDSLVVAEGIETAAQAAQLRSLGVQYGQGYYFAKPMPLAELLQYLENNQRLQPSV